MPNGLHTERAGKRTAADVLGQSAVLGAIFGIEEGTLRPNLSRLLELAPESFNDPALGKIAVAIRTVRSEPGIPVNLVTVGQLLPAELAGRLATLKDDALPPDLAELQAEEMLEATEQRRKVALLGEAYALAKNNPHRGAVIIEELFKSLESSNGHHRQPPQTLTFVDGLNYDTANDPNTLVGLMNGKMTRYLCRGYGSWLIGPSGIGKSVLLFQLACLLALGRSMFGITPVRPLRVLLLQAENDIGDLAEMVQGVASALVFDAFHTDFETLNRNVKIITDRSHTGENFCRWMGREISRFEADMVLVDPLLSYAGIDVSRQDQCSKFCRQWLDPILSDTGAALIGSHHTGKPKPIRDTRLWTPIEYAYAGLGSSELVNWARAIIVIVPHADAYELKLLKRGTRAGATHPDGTPTCSILMKQSDGKLWWEQVQPPEAESKNEQLKGGRPSKVDQALEIGLGFVIDSLTEPVSKNEVARRIEAFCAKAEPWQSRQGPALDVSLTVCKQVVERLVARGAVKKQEKGYIKA